MIVTPPFIQVAASSGGGGGGLPVPNTSGFTWILQSPGATMSNVAQGLQLVSPVAGAGGTAAAAIASTSAVPSPCQIYLQTFTTDFTHGASQLYGACVGLYDNVHGQMVGVGFSSRFVQPAGTFAVGRFTRARFTSADGGAYTNLVGSLSAVPAIVSITYDGTTFTYYYGSTVASLISAGSDSLTTIRGIVGATFSPNTAAIWQENQDGPPGFPGTNTSIFSGFEVTT